MTHPDRSTLIGHKVVQFGNPDSLADITLPLEPPCVHRNGIFLVRICILIELKSYKELTALILQPDLAVPVNDDRFTIDLGRSAGSDGTGGILFRERIRRFCF